MMKTKIAHSLAIMAVICSPLFFSFGVTAQTAGTLTFSVTTTFTGGSWGAKSNFVVWIENSTGTFVKTRVLYGSELDHLKQWTIKTPTQNTVDAIVGATKTTNPFTYSAITWTGNDLTGSPPYNLLPDGIYTVGMELAWGTSYTLGTGRQIFSASFTKGPSPQTVTPANQTNFTGMTLQWVPVGVGIENINAIEKVNIFPNPVTDVSTVNYTLNDLCDVKVSLYDVSGKFVSMLFDSKQDAGNYTLPLSLNGKVKPGVYFVEMSAGKAKHIERILISE